MDVFKLARFLGWFSIGLGAFELLRGGSLGRTLGLEERTGLLRFFGARELATGVGIFASTRKKRWLWGRVIGDAIDLAVLATALRPGNPRRKAAVVAAGNVAAVTALDIYVARSLPV